MVMKRSALGRGLDALITMDDLKTSGSSSISEIELSKIQPNPEQPRSVFEQESLEELAASIRSLGVIQPITLKETGTDQYMIISGERRYRASLMAGLTSVPAYIRTAADDNVVEMALIENIQRCDLNYFEEAMAIQKLMKMAGYTQQAVAKKLGKNQSTVANKLRLLQFSKEVQEEIVNHGLTERHARALLCLNDQGDEVILSAIKTIAEKEMNVAQTERYLAQLQGKQQQKRRDKNRLFVVRDLRIFLNTIDKALETMRLSGIKAQTQVQEESDELVYTIRIPKESAYKKKIPS